MSWLLGYLISVSGYVFGRELTGTLFQWWTHLVRARIAVLGRGLFVLYENIKMIKEEAIEVMYPGLDYSWDTCFQVPALE